MRLQLLALWRLPRKEPQERLVLRLALLGGYGAEIGSFSGPGTHDVFTLAIVIVGGIVVTQPLGAIAHFSHRPHWGRRLAKNPLRGQARQNRFGAETQYAKFWPIGCWKKLARQNLAYCDSAHFHSRGDFSPFYSFCGRKLLPWYATTAEELLVHDARLSTSTWR